MWKPTRASTVCASLMAVSLLPLAACSTGTDDRVGRVVATEVARIPPPPASVQAPLPDVPFLNRLLTIFSISPETPTPSSTSPAPVVPGR